MDAGISAESQTRVRVALVRVPFTLSAAEIGSLMAATRISYKTIKNWMKGLPIREGNEQSLEVALKKCGFEKQQLAAPRRRIVDVGGTGKAA